MAVDMAEWARNRPDAAASGSRVDDEFNQRLQQNTAEDPVPTRVYDPEEAQNLLGGGDRSPQQMENMSHLLEAHLQEIEDQLDSMDPIMLLSDEQELPEDHADQILELVDNWGDGFPELLADISPESAIAIANSVQKMMQRYEPMLVAAWLWRAGALITSGGSEEDSQNSQEPTQ